MNSPLSGDIDLYGVFFPTPLLLMGAAYLLKGVFRSVLARVGFYSHVWHPGLFNVALYVVVFGGLVALVNGARS